MRVLFLDDDPKRHAAMRRLSIGHVVTYVWTAAEAIEALRRERFDLACLDHDLGGKTFVDSLAPEGTGYTVAKAITESVQRPHRVIVHSFNPAGAERMVRKLQEADIPAVHAMFGSWQLEN